MTSVNLEWREVPADPHCLRAKVWHFENYTCGEDSPYHWRVKHGDRTLAFGEESSLKAARYEASKVIMATIGGRS